MANELSEQEKLYLTEDEIASLDVQEDDDPDVAAVAAGEGEAPKAPEPGTKPDGEQGKPENAKPAQANQDTQGKSEPEGTQDAQGKAQSSPQEGDEQATETPGEQPKQPEVAQAFNIDAIASLADPYVDTSIVPPVENLQQRIKEIEDKIIELGRQFETGESDITDASELKRRELQLNREIGRLETQDSLHQQSKASKVAREEQAWTQAAGSFIRSVRASGGPNYDAPELANELLDALTLVNAKATREGKSFTRMQTLAEAHKVVARMHPEWAAKPVTQQTRKTPEVPRNIANLPSASAHGVKGGEFAHLEKLDPLDQELAFAKMSEDQQRRYLEG